MKSIIKTLLVTLLTLVSTIAVAQAPPPEAKPDEGTPVVAKPAPPPVATPTIGPTREIKIGEHFALRFGLQAQVWANAAQDQTAAMMVGDENGYQNSIYLRRARVLAGVKPWDNIELFVLVEGSDLGKVSATGAKNSNINILDAYGEVKFHDAFILTAGQILVPVNRNTLQGTTTYLGLDIGNTSAATVAALQTQMLRDPGLQVKGTVLSDRFEYRLGVFSGIREAATTTPMSTQAEWGPRLSAYLQYNFLDPDKGYVFNGTYYGKKSILGLAVAGDYQKGSGLDPYRAYSAAAFAAIPIFGANPKTGADEVAALLQYVNYDGQETAPTLLKQNDFLAELAYYNRYTRLSVFGKVEGMLFVDKASTPADETERNILWYGGGMKYHMIDNLCNFTLAYNRMSLPNAPLPDGVRTGANQFTFAAQILYY